MGLLLDVITKTLEAVDELILRESLEDGVLAVPEATDRRILLSVSSDFWDTLDLHDWT